MSLFCKENTLNRKTFSMFFNEKPLDSSVLFFISVISLIILFDMLKLKYNTNRLSWPWLVVTMQLLISQKFLVTENKCKCVSRVSFSWLQTLDKVVNRQKMSGLVLRWSARCSGLGEPTVMKRWVSPAVQTRQRLLSPTRCAETGSCDVERSETEPMNENLNRPNWELKDVCFLTGFGGRSDSCSTMDLDWLRRSPGLCELLMRSCTAPCVAGLRGGASGGCLPALWRFVILCVWI